MRVIIYKNNEDVYSLRNKDLNRIRKWTNPRTHLTQVVRPTQRAPDWWESARFQAVCAA